MLRLTVNPKVSFVIIFTSIPYSKTSFVTNDTSKIIRRKCSFSMGKVAGIIFSRRSSQLILYEKITVCVGSCSWFFMKLMRD